MSDTAVLNSTHVFPRDLLRAVRAALILLAILSAPPLLHFCGEDGTQPKPAPAKPDAGAPIEPYVFFVSPHEGDHLPVTFALDFGVERFTLEPADGSNATDRGHLHVIIDDDCLEPGEKMTPDFHHVELDGGQKEVLVELPRGEHDFCAQLASGNHLALDATARIHVTID